MNNVLWIATLVVAMAAGTVTAQSVPNARLSVEGVAGVVGSYSSGQDVDVILRSDVYLYAALFVEDPSVELSDSNESLPGVATDAVLREEQLGAAYDRILGEVLIAREARRVRVAGPSDAMLEEELARTVSEAGGSERMERVLQDLGASRDEVVAIAARRAWVGNFLSVNLEGATTVTEAEIDAAIEARGGEVPGALADRTTIRTGLAKQALERAVRRWVGVLRVRTPHRELLEFPR